MLLAGWPAWKLRQASIIKSAISLARGALGLELSV